MELSQKVDGIVLKLNCIGQNNNGKVLQAQSPLNTSSNPTHKMIQLGIDTNEDEDNFIVTDDDIAEINAEMEDLFGSPISTIKP